MKIVLATGIYPPAIGGPATYARALAQELTMLGHGVSVVTYASDRESGIGNRITEHRSPITDPRSPITNPQNDFQVHNVSSSIPILRWFWYAQKLREVAADADIVYAFSSVSSGIPLLLSGLKKPKRVLRLGGDFFWERYTDLGGKKSLREWYKASSWFLVPSSWFLVPSSWFLVPSSWFLVPSSWLLRQYHHIVFSTEFQQEIYKKAFKNLPQNSVIENALALEEGIPKDSVRIAHVPFRLMFMGRFVPFKNIIALIEAAAQIPDCVLTIVGEGPLELTLRKRVADCGIETRVRFVPVLSGGEKQDVFTSHDLLVLPSLTEVSPNTALEARAAGLPVLLTQEHGLSSALLSGIVPADLSTPGNIAAAIGRVRQGYSFVAEAVAKRIPGRAWSIVAKETVEVFTSITN